MTDLDGYLKNDADNLSMRVSLWVSTLKPSDLPGKVVITWRVRTGRSEGPAGELPIAAKPDPATLIDSIAKLIREKLGPDPTEGHLRVRISNNKKASIPEIDFSRLLIAGGAGEDPNLSLLRQELDYSRQQIREKDALLAQLTVSAHQLSASLAQSVGSLGAQRAVGATAADIGTPGAIIGLGVFLMAYPAAKRLLGLPDGAGFEEVLEAGAAALNRGKIGGARKVDVETLPRGASYAPLLAVFDGAGPPFGFLGEPGEAAEAGETPAPPMPQEAANTEIDEDAFIERLRHDDAFARRLGRRILGDTFLALRLQQLSKE